MIPSSTFALVLLALLAGVSTVQPPHGEEALVNTNPQKISPVEGLPKVEVQRVFPVPTSSRCIVILVCQYMIIHTALALLRIYYSWTYTPPLVKYKTRALTNAAQTLSYQPMLCVLFMACRMRVEFLSDGKGSSPQWVHHCMYALTFAVLANSVIVLVYPLILGKSAELRATGDLESPSFSPRFQSHLDYQCKFYTVTALRFLIMLGLYGGIIGVIMGMFLYLPPDEKDLSKVPPPAAAISCAMILTVGFFLTQLVVMLCQCYTDARGIDYFAGHIHKITQVMNSASTTLEFSPMAAVVFLAARMRAMQHDSEPQEWAQTCMYAATGALCLTALMAIVVPCALGGTTKTNATTKEVTFEVPNPTLGYVMVTIRFISLVAFYAGVGGVVCSIFTFQAPEDYETRPVSPTVHCVVTLAFQFFFVYAALIGCLTVSEISGGRIPLEKYRFYIAVEAAKTTIAWAPMLAILFVTTRMYALLITDKLGSPQGWVQDAMYMATWSILISFLSCLVAGFLVGEDADGIPRKVEQDEDGNVMHRFSNESITLAMAGIRYFTTTLLYGGIITVIVGLFVMTPETANGRGAIPGVSHIRKATQR